MILIAQLSDTHFDGHDRSRARAAQVMDYLNALPGRLDAIVHTGDITDHGLPAEHEEAAKTLVSAVPLYTCPGNHDGYTPYEGPLNQAAEVGPAVLLLADSVIQGRDDGALSDETLDWLATELASVQGRRPVLIAFHHPPVVLHHGLMDSINLADASQRPLADLMAEHPNVAGILCGHAHMPAASSFAGRPVLVAPGVISRLALPWEVEGELTWKKTIDFGQPPAVAFHVLDDHGRITTHYRFLEFQ
jgi:3',5'-cyclic AMP phosphodiesterase CpdA